MKKVLPVLLLLFFVVRPAFASEEKDDDNFRPEVLRCEEALGKLVECCPSFDPKSVDCSFSQETRESSGCDSFSTSVSVRPALDDGETSCILDRDCAALTEVCKRATGVGAYVVVLHDQDGPEPWASPSTHPPVCP